MNINLKKYLIRFEGICKTYVLNAKPKKVIFYYISIYFLIFKSVIHNFLAQ